MYAGCGGHYEITDEECGGYPVYHNKNKNADGRMIYRSSAHEKWGCTPLNTLASCRAGFFASASASSDQVEGPWGEVSAVCQL